MTKSAFIKEVHDAEAMLYHVAKSILKNDADYIKKREIFPNLDHPNTN